MDFEAFWEAASAVLITPLASIVLALLVIGALFFVFRRIQRR